MAKCGWCGATNLSNTTDGLETHKPGFKKDVPATTDCKGYATYLEKESQPK